MPNTLPTRKTNAAPDAPTDFSRAGVVLPILAMEPTDDVFGGAAVDGTTVLQAGATDSYYVQWVRINGAWRSTFMAI